MSQDANGNGEKLTSFLSFAVDGAESQWKKVKGHASFLF